MKRVVRELMEQDFENPVGKSPLLFDHDVIHGFIGPHGRPVRALACEGFVDIGDGNYHGHLIAIKTLGVAVAVRALVFLGDHPRQPSELVSQMGLNDPASVFSVPLNDSISREVSGTSL